MSQGPGGAHGIDVNSNLNLRNVQKEVSDLVKPLSDALERLQVLRCSVDSVFTFLKGDPL